MDKFGPRYVSLDQYLKQRGQTLFEFISQKYKDRWGKSPTKAQVDRYIKRYGEIGRLPDFCYGKKIDTLPKRAYPP